MVTRVFLWFHMSGSFHKIKEKVEHLFLISMYLVEMLFCLVGENHRIFFPLSENRATVPDSVHHALLLKLGQGLVSVSKEEMLNGLLDGHSV